MTEGFVLNQVQIDLSKMIKFLLLYYIMESNCETEPLVLSGSQIVFDVDKTSMKSLWFKSREYFYRFDIEVQAEP